MSEGPKCRHCGFVEDNPVHRHNVPENLRHEFELVAPLPPQGEPPIPPEKCRKCGNPNGYDAFWREDPPFYACGKCGERENPEGQVIPVEPGPDTCIGIINISDVQSCLVVTKDTRTTPVYLKDLWGNHQTAIIEGQRAIEENKKLKAFVLFAADSMGMAINDSVNLFKVVEEAQRIKKELGA